MTVINRVAPGLAVLVLCITMQGFVGVASGQEMTEQQRLERCQNNLNRLAELEQQLRLTGQRIEGTIERASKAVKAKDKASSQSIAIDDFLLPETGDSDLDNKISETWNKCLAAEMLIFPNLPEAKRECLDALLSGLQRAQEDATLEAERLMDRQNNLRWQMENHRTNLTALRCDEPGGVVPNLTATWKVTQGNYTGWLFLHQTGVYLTGSLMWQNHEPGSIVSGTVGKGSISFTIQYATGGSGIYNGTIDPSGKSMQGNTTGTLGAGPWTMTWAAEASR